MVQFVYIYIRNCYSYNDALKKHENQSSLPGWTLKRQTILQKL